MSEVTSDERPEGKGVLSGARIATLEMLLLAMTIVGARRERDI